MQVGDVLVGRTGTAVSPFFEAALKLGENPEMPSEMPIRMKHVTLQDVSGRGLGANPKSWIFVVFVPVTDFAADREIPVLASERYVFDFVQHFFLAGRFGKEAPVFFVPQGLQFRPLFLTLRRRDHREKREE